MVVSMRLFLRWSIEVLLLLNGIVNITYMQAVGIGREHFTESCSSLDSEHVRIVDRAEGDEYPFVGKHIISVLLKNLNPLGCSEACVLCEIIRFLPVPVGKNSDGPVFALDTPTAIAASVTSARNPMM